MLGLLILIVALVVAVTAGHVFRHKIPPLKAKVEEYEGMQDGQLYARLYGARKELFFYAFIFWVLVTCAVTTSVIFLYLLSVSLGLLDG